MANAKPTMRAKKRCAFPPEDDLEGLEAHALIDELVLGDLPVFLEGILPVGVGEGRNDAHDRPPFGDGEARVGEPRGAADDDQREDERGDTIKPPAHGALGVIGELASRSVRHGKILS